MKKLLVALPVLFGVAFGLKKHAPAFTPPGTVKINDSLYADATEITNFSWMEFEQSVKTKYGEGSPEHLAVLPDLKVWNRCGASADSSYGAVYYRHPAFRHYPVVGICYEQALAFCLWRSEIVNKTRAQAHVGGARTLVYRLPTRQEWEWIEGDGREVYWAKNEVVSVHNSPHKKVYKVNYRAQCFISDSLSNARFSSAVGTYVKNGFGMYDMIGNVAEMVHEKGVSKGGSWRHTLEQCRVGKNHLYSAPEAWLGFRCVCVLR